MPDEKSMMVYLCYASARLLDSRREVKACLLIQNRYRKHYQRKMLLRQRSAASVILREWRLRRATYYHNQRVKYAGPVATIIEFVLSRRAALKAMKILRLETERQQKAAVLIQGQIRKHLAMQHVSVIRCQHVVALNMQCMFRGMKARQRFEVLFRQISASVQIQSLWRGYSSRNSLLVTLSSIIDVQARVRKNIARKRYIVAREASIYIQKVWRAFSGQLKYQIDLMDIIAIQSMARRRNAIRDRHARSKAVVKVQLAARFFLARCKLLRRRQAVQAQTRNHTSAVICQVR